MTFRTRMLLTFLLAVLIPLVALSLMIRLEMKSRMRAQYERRVESLVSVIEEDIAQENERLAGSLAVLRAAVLMDNRFRRAAVDGVAEERRYLLDYAESAMNLSGLSMLQIQDSSGRIISSGHFRNEYGRMEPELPRLLASAPEGRALVQARSPEAPFLALARVDSFRMGNNSFFIVAGLVIEERFLSRLAREEEMAVVLVYPGGVLSASDGAYSVDSRETSAGAVVRELEIPYIDSRSGGITEADFKVTHEVSGLEALLSGIDRWFLAAIAVTAVTAILLVSWLTARISRPLVQLADKTSRLDLDSLDIQFDSDRKDEIGSLSRLLGDMTGRLRTSAARIREAEHRATLGELARQVNHDIKNGLTPIRNVIRHLSGLVRSDPESLPEVFRERQGNLDSSIEYLENLASNYARLSPRKQSERFDASKIISGVVSDTRGRGNIELDTDISGPCPIVGDPVSFRRIMENVIGNAADSIGDSAGRIAVLNAVVDDPDGHGHMRIMVKDTGAGMSEETAARIFEDFYTTKDNGIGLGLSIVRRLVMDLGGRMDVESEPGRGTTFVIDIPMAGEGGGEGDISPREKEG